MNNEENVNQNDARAILDGSNGKHKICLLSIIGEVEGHENLSGNTKTTKYDQILPKLAQLEDDDSVEGLLVLLNTSGQPAPGHRRQGRARRRRCPFR